MNKFLFFVAGCLLLIACSSEKVNFGQLQDRNGLFYLINKDKPFSGEIVSYANGRVEFEGKITNGLREGLWTYYYPSGQKKEEGNYKDGLKDGNWVNYKENGTMDQTETFKFGKSLSAEGAQPKKDSIPITTGTSTTQPVKEKKAPTVVWERLRGGPIKYLDGVPYTGFVIKYQRNGLKEFDGYFYDGRKSGKWTYYDRFGNVRDIRHY